MARNPKQDANLKPIKRGDLSDEELKKRQRNGGIKSGESRRKKRDAREAMKYLLGLPAKGNIDVNLKELGLPDNERTNMAALQARMFTLAMSGNIDAYTQVLKVAGYEPEENRKERESIASDARRNLETEAKLNALGANGDNVSVAINTSDEDGRNDVVIYLPEIDKIEDCELPPEEDISDIDDVGNGESNIINNESEDHKGD